MPINWLAVNNPESILLAWCIFISFFSMIFDLLDSDILVKFWRTVVYVHSTVMNVHAYIHVIDVRVTVRSNHRQYYSVFRKLNQMNCKKLSYFIALGSTIYIYLHKSVLWSAAASIFSFVRVLIAWRATYFVFHVFSCITQRNCSYPSIHRSLRSFVHFFLVMRWWAFSNLVRT